MCTPTVIHLSELTCTNPNSIQESGWVLRVFFSWFNLHHRTTCGDRSEPDLVRGPQTPTGGGRFRMAGGGICFSQGGETFVRTQFSKHAAHTKLPRVAQTFTRKHRNLRKDLHG